MKSNSIFRKPTVNYPSLRVISSLSCKCIPVCNITLSDGRVISALQVWPGPKRRDQETKAGPGYWCPLHCSWSRREEPSWANEEVFDRLILKKTRGLRGRTRAFGRISWKERKRRNRELPQEREQRFLQRWKWLNSRSCISTSSRLTSPNI